MARREAHDAADSRLRARNDQVVLVLFLQLISVERIQGRVVVGEDEGFFVIWIPGSAGASIMGTQVTFGVVLWLSLACYSFNLPLPWALCTVWRDQHPFPRKLVET